MARTILVSDNPHGEGNVLTGETINPGHLIDIDPTTGDLLVHQTAAANAVPRSPGSATGSATMPTMRTLLVSGSTTSPPVLAIGCTPSSPLPQPLWLGVTSSNLLGTARCGSSPPTRPRTTPSAESVIAQALEAVDNSGGGSEAWILVEVL